MFNFFKKTPIEKPAPRARTRKAKDAPVEKIAPSELLQAISAMQRELDRLKLAITTGRVDFCESVDGEGSFDQSLSEIKARSGAVQKSETEKVIEGVFDGQYMIGADGQQYDVPANYASKSKLVEGDILKLTINNLGAFIYKQIKPIERLRQVGRLEQDRQNLQFYAVENGKKWKLLTASVTYYKGESGDEVVFLTPADGGSKWAAVENIVKA